jgi:hypothetical protein
MKNRKYSQREEKNIKTVSWKPKEKDISRKRGKERQQ